IIQNLFPLEAIKTDELVALLRQDNYSVQLSVSSKLEEGQKVEVNVTPLTDEAIAFYQDPIPVEFADGYTRFMFDITCEGVYKITMEKKGADGSVLATLDTYYSFSYSQEYNFFPDRELIGEE
ncbi:MAG: hypothetical protein K2J16_02165, partial [Clostridia bacterium]|nr:hypothetical protein [Clostridia bacterium]